MSGNPAIIDTVAVLQKVHEIYSCTKDMPDGPERTRLLDVADSAFSAVLIYMRHSTAVVQRKHYDSIKRLDDVLPIPG